MSLKKKRKTKKNKNIKYSTLKKILLATTICLSVLFIFVGYKLFCSPILNGGKSEIIFVYPNTTKSDLSKEMHCKYKINNPFLFDFCLKYFIETNIIPTGRYKLEENASLFNFLRIIRSKMQYPVKITINNIRTKDQLLSLLSDKLMLSKDDFNKILSNEKYCEAIGSDTINIIGTILPDTYEFYWDITPGKLMDSFKKQYDKFWNNQRLDKAKVLGLSPKEITIIASIVEQESNKKAEYGKIGRLYINRYNINMPLQADPTVKFALNDFSIKRITKEHLSVKSPYNTYANKGLPPGPICIPNKQTIDAILNSDKHTFLYMCAKEDFSGYHNFATSYEEHLKNAKKYQQELDKRNIK